MLEDEQAGQTRRLSALRVTAGAYGYTLPGKAALVRPIFLVLTMAGRAADTASVKPHTPLSNNLSAVSVARKRTKLRSP
jgi:hypothetical protein